MNRILQLYNIVRNMGLRYISFRAFFEIRKKSGLLKYAFPAKPPFETFINLSEWKNNSKFLSFDKISLNDFKPSEIPDFKLYLTGRYPFFSSEWKNLNDVDDWLTNPDTGHKFDGTTHWSEIEDFNEVHGDIKFVWERSRFSFLYDVIRHAHYTTEDHSEWIFKQIISWIDSNPVNCGPNYKCSQEISLRVLNWTYALHYYRDSAFLTEEIFQKIMYAIYWQLKHVYKNINFSRIAVRNNHAITETLTLYLGGLFFPFFPGAAAWKTRGKSWFEKEIEYQIYPDGTFLQFSMNYHRIVIQLFTWAFVVSELFNERFKESIYRKAYYSLKFLFSCQNPQSGWLPNYGHNDGALFFKLNSCDYRDYRPQLNVLHVLLTGEQCYENQGGWSEDIFWFNAKKLPHICFEPLSHQNGWCRFDFGGYYVLRDGDSMTFVRCGNHKDRPAQSDNLHLDIWIGEANIIFDGGSYKYNTDRTTLKYFMGTASHNTVMLDNYDQMLKGSRFVWYNWSQAVEAGVSESQSEYVFEGEISAFSYLATNIRHRRKISKLKGRLVWTVEDQVFNKPAGLSIRQIWHLVPGLKISAEDSQQVLEAVVNVGWKSDYYGQKTVTKELVFESQISGIKTTISAE